MQAVILTLAILFWLPGFMALLFVPYQKLWLCIGQEYETLYLTITCLSTTDRTILENRFKRIHHSFLDSLNKNYSQVFLIAEQLKPNQEKIT